jgi:hypothetical protein
MIHDPHQREFVPFCVLWSIITFCKFYGIPWKSFGLLIGDFFIIGFPWRFKNFGSNQRGMFIGVIIGCLLFEEFGIKLSCLTVFQWILFEQFGGYNDITKTFHTGYDALYDWIIQRE